MTHLFLHRRGHPEDLLATAQLEPGRDVTQLRKLVRIGRLAFTPESEFRPVQAEPDVVVAPVEEVAPAIFEPLPEPEPEPEPEPRSRIGRRKKKT